MTAPILIARAPYESTMGLVQKIFYFHMPPAMLMLLSAIFCGIVSGIFLVRRRPFYDWMAFAAAELTVLYGAMAMVTGPLWARKAWGVWWVWDPRLTMSLLLWMVFVSYLLLRRYGGPGSEMLAAGLALFGMATVAVRVSVGEHLANDPPADVGRADASGRFRLSAVVCVRRLSAALHRADDAAHGHRAAAHDAGPALSRERGMKTIYLTVLLLMNAVVFAQPGQSEFMPVTEIPASEQLPSAPLVIAAYAFVWLAFMVYVWMMWRKLGKVEQELEAPVRAAREKAPMNFANMTSAHFIFIPVVLFVGIVIGWILGSRAAQDAYAMEMKKTRRSKGPGDETGLDLLPLTPSPVPYPYPVYRPIPSRYASIGGRPASRIFFCAASIGYATR